MVKQSSHTRWKGCPLCSEHKHKAHGDAYRLLTPQAMRAVGVKRRWNRHDVPERDDVFDEDTDPYDTDCQHGCNGTCFVSGSERCNFTCHPAWGQVFGDEYLAEA